MSCTMYLNITLLYKCREVKWCARAYVSYFSMYLKLTYFTWFLLYSFQHLWHQDRWKLRSFWEASVNKVFVCSDNGPVPTGQGTIVEPTYDKQCQYIYKYVHFESGINMMYKKWCIIVEANATTHANNKNNYFNNPLYKHNKTQKFHYNSSPVCKACSMVILWHNIFLFFETQEALDHLASFPVK